MSVHGWKEGVREAKGSGGQKEEKLREFLSVLIFCHHIMINNQVQANTIRLLMASQYILTHTWSQPIGTFPTYKRLA